MIQTSLLDLINEAHQAVEQRRLQNELPDEPKGWELFFQRLADATPIFSSTLTTRSSQPATAPATAPSMKPMTTPSSMSCYVATLEQIHPQR